MVVRLRLLAVLLAGLTVLAACGTPTPPVTTVELSVTIEGAGGGTVTSDPVGIDSGAGELAAEFDTGTEVTLTAAADANSVFAGFTGATCEAGSTATTCIVTLDAATVVTATFEPAPVEPTLTVVLDGSGTGAVTSDPAGIDSGAGEFSAEFGAGTEVTLTAAAGANSVFAGFTGATCEAGSTATTCIVTLDADTTVTATFDATAVLTVDVATGGASAGSVTSDPAGIDTTGAATDNATFLVGTTVTLTAAVDAGGFAGWTGGDCDGLKTLTCDVVVGVGEPTVAANFNDVQTLTVTVAASGDDAVEFLSDSISAPANNPAGWVWAAWQRFDLGYDPSHAQTQVGLRFPAVALPAGANVVEAVLQLSRYDSSAGTTGDLALAIRGQLATDAAGFPQDLDGAPSANITGRTDRTTASATWNISGAWVADQAYASPDIAAVVREIVALPAWEANDTVVLFLSNTDPLNVESRRVWSFDGVGAADPRLPSLIIEYIALPLP